MLFTAAALPTGERQPRLVERMGEHSTQLPAGVKPEQGSVAFLQLKWPDIFGLSPKERESRRRWELRLHVSSS